MQEKRIFLAIPAEEWSGVSTYRPRDLKKVRERSDLVAARFSKGGWKVVNPLDNYTGPRPAPADLAADYVRMALGCDALYLGWEYYEDWRLELVRQAVVLWNRDDSHVKIDIMYGE